MNVNWECVNVIFKSLDSCCNCISVIILLASLIAVFREIRAMKNSTCAGAFKGIIDILQSEDIRNARAHVIKKLGKKPFESWDENDRIEAEKVCQTYDTVGQMVRYKIVPKKYVVDHWGASLRRVWLITLPLVFEYRCQSNAAERWDDYEWLAKEAKSFQKPLF